MLIVPPGSGIVHQVNLEYLARVCFNENGKLLLFNQLKFINYKKLFLWYHFLLFVLEFTIEFLLLGEIREVPY